MKTEEIVIYSSKIGSRSDGPLCVIRFDGKRFVVHAINEKTAREFAARIKMSQGWPKFGERISSMSSIFRGTFGPIVKSKMNGSLGKNDAIEALSKMKFKMSFDYNPNEKKDSRKKSISSSSILEIVPVLKKTSNEK